MWQNLKGCKGFTGNVLRLLQILGSYRTDDEVMLPLRQWSYSRRGEAVAHTMKLQQMRWSYCWYDEDTADVVKLLLLRWRHSGRSEAYLGAMKPHLMKPQLIRWGRWWCDEATADTMQLQQMWWSHYWCDGVKQDSRHIMTVGQTSAHISSTAVLYRRTSWQHKYINRQTCATNRLYISRMTFLQLLL
jgi:hypothetical protein